MSKDNNNQTIHMDGPTNQARYQCIVREQSRYQNGSSSSSSEGTETDDSISLGFINGVIDTYQRRIGCENSSPQHSQLKSGVLPKMGVSILRAENETSTVDSWKRNIPNKESEKQEPNKPCPQVSSQSGSGSGSCYSAAKLSAAKAPEHMMSIQKESQHKQPTLKSSEGDRSILQKHHLSSSPEGARKRDRPHQHRHHHQQIGESKETGPSNGSDKREREEEHVKNASIPVRKQRHNSSQHQGVTKNGVSNSSDALEGNEFSSCESNETYVESSSGTEGSTSTGNGETDSEQNAAFHDSSSDKSEMDCNDQDQAEQQAARLSSTKKPSRASKESLKASNDKSDKRENASLVEDAVNDYQKIYMEMVDVRAAEGLLWLSCKRSNQDEVNRHSNFATTDTSSITHDNSSMSKNQDSGNSNFDDSDSTSSVAERSNSASNEAGLKKKNKRPAKRVLFERAEVDGKKSVAKQACEWESSSSNEELCHSREAKARPTYGDIRREGYSSSISSLSNTAVSSSSLFSPDKSDDSGEMHAMEGDALAFDNIGAVPISSSGDETGSTSKKKYISNNCTSSNDKRFIIYHKDGNQNAASRGISLASPSDKFYLPPLQCFCRKHVIELFVATTSDIQELSSRRKIRVGQVGMRCLWCASIPTQQRALKYTLFPSAVKRLYHNVEEIRKHHFSFCTEVPKSTRKDYRALFLSASNDNTTAPASSSSLTSTPRRTQAQIQYWTDSAKALGLIDTVYGIRFRSSMDINMKTDSNASEEKEREKKKSLVTLRPALSQLPISPPLKPLPKEENITFLPQNDKSVSHFVYLLLEQLKPALWCENVSLNSRSHIQMLVRVGLACKHCSKPRENDMFYTPGSPNASFPMPISDIEDTAMVETQEEIFPSFLTQVFTHVTCCTSCPSDVKERIECLKKSHTDHTNSLRHGTKGLEEFLKSMWIQLSTLFQLQPLPRPAVVPGMATAI